MSVTGVSYRCQSYRCDLNQDHVRDSIPIFRRHQKIADKLSPKPTVPTFIPISTRIVARGRIRPIRGRDRRTRGDSTAKGADKYADSRAASGTFKNPRPTPSIIKQAIAARYFRTTFRPLPSVVLGEFESVFREYRSAEMRSSSIIYQAVNQIALRRRHRRRLLASLQVLSST